MESKLISIEEANRMLPLLRQIVADITANWDKIIYKRTELECLEKGLDGSGAVLAAHERDLKLQGLKQELNTLIDRINSYIREVEDLGCFVEEFKRGIINFPSLYNGRKVFLCWKPDEQGVTHWHELDESFNDRVRIRDVGEFLYQKPRV
ncbi:MAG: DUF2203 domain-containing protein [Planctomycetes bacterium]|nr:DUF2203 domain-containing protein [Planctomycetota bacterium]